MASDTGEDLYSDQSSEPYQAESETSEEGGQTALVPKSFFGGKDLKPGATCAIRVDRVLEDQVEVSYAHSGQKPMERDEEMERMME